MSFRQAITPGRMQGRMNATMRFIVWGTIPIGSLLGGALGGIIGLHETLWVAAIGLAIPFLFVLFSPVRGIGTMPAQVDDDAAGPGAGPGSAPGRWPGTRTRRHRPDRSGRQSSSIGTRIPRARAISIARS